MIKVKLTLALLLISLSSTVFSQIKRPKQIIQVKFVGATTSSISFFNYDSAYLQQFIRFTNAKTDTIINKENSLPVGEVLQYSMQTTKDGKPFFVSKSFIVPPSVDTIKFLIGSDYLLKIEDGVNFFIEDAIDILYADPRRYRHVSNLFLDKDNGLNVIDSIYNSNMNRIEKGLAGKLLLKHESEILSVIAKTDYYTRSLMWAQSGDRYPEIADRLGRLANDKEILQSVQASPVTLFFGNYIGYVYYKQFAKQSPIKMIQAIINLGWGKNITSEYLTMAFKDLSIDADTAVICYDMFQKYLNGEFPDKLLDAAKTILPKLVHTDKAVIQAVDGTSLTFKQFLSKNPDKHIVIDFWASWCAPCREESPSFELAKADFKGTNIVFMSISLDEDVKSDLWKKALMEDGLAKAENQFKLMSPTDNPMLDSFGISSIPRYIVINSKGEFIYANFHRPSDPKFNEALRKLDYQVKK